MEFPAIGVPLRGAVPDRNARDHPGWSSRTRREQPDTPSRVRWFKDAVYDLKMLRSPKYTLTYIYLHIYIYANVYIQMYTYIHTYVHTYLLTYVRTYLLTYILTYIHTYIYIYTHIQMYAYTHTRTCTVYIYIKHCLVGGFKHVFM